MSEQAGGQWWYCLKHNRPEHDADCPGKYLMGPYPDEATAANAMRIAAERNEAWDQDEEKDA